MIIEGLEDLRPYPFIIRLDQRVKPRVTQLQKERLKAAMGFWREIIEDKLFESLSEER